MSEATALPTYHHHCPKGLLPNIMCMPSGAKLRRRKWDRYSTSLKPSTWSGSRTRDTCRTRHHYAIGNWVLQVTYLCYTLSSWTAFCSLTMIGCHGQFCPVPGANPMNGSKTCNYKEILSIHKLIWNCNIFLRIFTARNCKHFLQFKTACNVNFFTNHPATLPEPKNPLFLSFWLNYCLQTWR